MMNASALSTMGHVGLTLLILSGGYLASPYWSYLTDMPYLMAKLILVLVLAALIGIMTSMVRKVKNGGSPALMGTVRSLGMLAMLVGISIVICAVMTFR